MTTNRLPTDSPLLDLLTDLTTENRRLLAERARLDRRLCTAIGDASHYLTAAGRANAETIRLRAAIAELVALVDPLAGPAIDAGQLRSAIGPPRRRRPADRRCGMTPTAFIVIMLASLAIVTALSLAVTWAIEPGNPDSPDPDQRRIRFRFQSLYRWGADNGPIGIAVVVAIFAATYLGLCLAAVAIIRLIPGLVA